MPVSIRSVSYVALQCRDTLHAYDEMAFTDYRPMFGKPREMRCRCGSSRFEIVNALGEIDRSTRHYHYSPEYKVALMFTREDCRKERYRRDRARVREQPRRRLLKAV